MTESISDEEVPCIFISYQRKDEEYANEIADYIMSKQIDVYFDLDDHDLKQHNQTSNPHGVTNAIKAGLNKSDYMIVIVSPNTYRSLWVPFEIGYSFTEPDYRRNGISKELKKELLNQMKSHRGTIFSTTAIKSSQTFLEENGLKKHGKSFDGETDKGIAFYERT